MEKPINSGEINELVHIMNSYVRDPTEENLKKVHENLDRIGASIDWVKFYLKNIDSPGDELTPYLTKFLNSAKIISRYMFLEKKKKQLQKMDIFSSPYSVGERLKRNS